MLRESIGIIGSVLVLTSFLMKDIKKIRIVNIFGALLFVIYGIWTNTFATWFLNGMLIIIHLIYIVRKK